ncbi:hypothetical protein KEM52_005498 [Ascosphaera acerosa]|nr:hypothetical protein KEM52_005498 [Ascosphaera acerosa]
MRPTRLAGVRVLTARGSQLDTTYFSDRRQREGKEDRDNDRLVSLGKTLRLLSAHLPAIFVHALPQEIMAPDMTLHLFPSTHPRLPAVKGRMPCTAALWTAPVAWGSVPIVGNVRIMTISEKMVKNAAVSDSPAKNSRLIVRWTTVTDGGPGRSAPPQPGSSENQSQRSAAHHDHAASHSVAGSNRGLSSLLGGDAPMFQLRKEEAFAGIFVFSFDEHGRISDLKIEHAEENDHRERPSNGVTSLADWLLGIPPTASIGGVNHAPNPAMHAEVAKRPDQR